MKKLFTIFSLIGLCILYISFSGDENKPLPIPANQQPVGNAEKGYQYLFTGDYLKSGFPLAMFSMVFGKDTTNYLQRQGLNKNTSQAIGGYNHFTIGCFQSSKFMRYTFI